MMLYPLFWWNEKLYWSMKLAAIKRHMALTGGFELEGTWHESIIRLVYPI